MIITLEIANVESLHNIKHLIIHLFQQLLKDSVIFKNLNSILKLMKQKILCMYILKH